MAFTGSPTSATPYSSQVDPTQGNVAQGENVGARLILAPFSYTHAAGAGTGEVNLIQLPPGRIHIYPELSQLVTSQFATSADFHLGHRAYTQEDGTTVVEDDNEWIDNGDVAAGALSGPWTTFFATGAGGTVGKTHAVYDAASGLIIFALIDAGNIEDTDTIAGWVAYTKEG